MAVYDRSYKPWTGEATPKAWRFLVLPRYLLKRVFAPKWAVMLLIGCFVPTIVGIVTIYIQHHAAILEQIGISIDQIDLIGPNFFQRVLAVQVLLLGFVLTLSIGPVLISSDMQFKALPLYFSRPLTRLEYVAGKATVLVLVLSAISWVPGLFMWLLQAYLAGDGWAFDNLRIAAGIFFGSWLWIVVLTLLTLAISALVKRRATASLTLFGLFFIVQLFGGMIYALGIPAGRMLMIFEMVEVVWDALYGTSNAEFGGTLLEASISIAVTIAVAVALLARRVKPFEVVR